jgi:hypothetical protein
MLVFFLLTYSKKVEETHEVIDKDFWLGAAQKIQNKRYRRLR